MRQFVLAANWKMNKTPVETAAFFQTFLSGFSPSPGRQTVFFVPALDITTAIGATNGRGVGIGTQNIHFKKKGAFTGENSAEAAKAAGCEWTLVGHSERRSLFGETDLITAKKMKLALECGLKPMLCVGESLDERTAGETMKVVERQLTVGLEAMTAADWASVTIAYEPVWAIGTGKVATPEQASEVHTAIRAWLERRAGAEVAAAMPILYGGSAKPENFREIASQKNIDGFLVGGASLEADSFLKFCAW